MVFLISSQISIHNGIGGAKRNAHYIYRFHKSLATADISLIFPSRIQSPFHRADYSLFTKAERYNAVSSRLCR